MIRKDTTPDLGMNIEDQKNVLSMQADIISVLSGHSHNRSGKKKYERERKMKFSSRAPMSMNNDFGYLYANNNMGLRKRSGTVVVTDNMLQSPKSFDEQYPDIEKDLNLESLSNGELSRHDATSMQRSFTYLNQQPIRGIVEDSSVPRRTISDNGMPNPQQHINDLANDFND